MKPTKLERLSTLSLEERLSRWAAQFEECPILHGNLIEVHLSAGVPETVAHKLPNKPTGVFPVVKGTPASVALISSDARTITVQASSDCDVLLWVW